MAWAIFTKEAVWVSEIERIFPFDGKEYGVVLSASTGLPPGRRDRTAAVEDLAMVIFADLPSKS